MSPTPLPPGQRERPDFPRFGLLPFATRFPSQTDRIDLHVSFPDSSDATPAPATATSTNVGAQLAQLPRVQQTSDFHCVATWTRRGLCWGGVRRTEYYGDFYEQIVVPLCLPDPTSGQAATDPAAAHFVVLRAQDGYKSVKHLHRIEFWRSDKHYRPYGLRFMVHPRARVALEERGPRRQCGCRVGYCATCIAR